MAFGVEIERQENGYTVTVCAPVTKKDRDSGEEYTSHNRATFVYSTPHEMIRAVGNAFEEFELIEKDKKAGDA